MSLIDRFNTKSVVVTINCNMIKHTLISFKTPLCLFHTYVSYVHVRIGARARNDIIFLFISNGDGDAVTFSGLLIKRNITSLLIRYQEKLTVTVTALK